MIARFVSGAVPDGNYAVRLWLRGHGEAEGFGVIVKNMLDDSAKREVPIPSPVRNLPVTRVSFARGWARD